MEELDRLIQYLPIDIQEKIYKHYLTAILKEKKELGWDYVHMQILDPGLIVINGCFGYKPFQRCFCHLFLPYF